MLFYGTSSLLTLCKFCCKWKSKNWHYVEPLWNLNSFTFKGTKVNLNTMLIKMNCFLTLLPHEGFFFLYVFEIWRNHMKHNNWILIKNPFDKLFICIKHSTLCNNDGINYLMFGSFMSQDNFTSISYVTYVWFDVI